MMEARQPGNVLEVKDLKAYYLMNYFGVSREVRAVDDITMSVRRNETYGIAGESSSGKTSFIKVLAAAIRPPLRVVEGSAVFDQIAYTKKNERTNELKTTMEGKVIATGDITVAADGKTRVVTVMMTGEDGKKMTSKAAYNKE